MEEASAGVVEEPWAYLGNPGVMELAALKASEEFAGAKVVLSEVDEYSAALAGHVAAVLKAKLCLASMKPSSQNLLLEHTRICGGLLGAVGVPRNCLERGAGTLGSKTMCKTVPKSSNTRVSLG